MAKGKNKYYAVAVGQKPGIYNKWFGEDGAEVQIKGFPKARFKGFPTLDDARTWLEESSGKMPQKTVSSKANKVKPKPTKVSSSEIIPPEEINEGKVILYTDGGCKNNPGPGGYGAVLLMEDKKKELSAGFKLTTNNRMELTACIEGLKALKRPFDVILFTDSQYVVNGIKKGWAKRWRRNGWMRAKDAPAENADLWEQLLELCDRHAVDFRWVKGHAGNPGNERCDQLAGIAALDKENLQHDIPFETGKTTKKTQGALFNTGSKRG